MLIALRAIVCTEAFRIYFPIVSIGGGQRCDE